MNKLPIDEETLYVVTDALNIGYLISSGKEQQRIFAARHKLLAELQKTKKHYSVLEWHPMSEKPKDLSDILVRDTNGAIFDSFAYYYENDWMIQRGDKAQIVEWAYPPEE